MEVRASRCGLTRKPMGGEGIEGFGLLGKQVFAGCGEKEVGVEVEAALGDDVGLEGADGSGGVVAGIGGRLEALGFAFFVGFAEGGQGHDDFAADFEGRRDVGLFQLRGGDGERDGADGADVGGDVFADGSVAASEAALKMGGTVGGGAELEGHREAVHFVFADVARCRRCRRPASGRGGPSRGVPPRW